MSDIERLRKMIAPEPTYYYPTPWRGAEVRDGQRIVTCASGSYTAECPTDEAADIIVAAVNAFAVTTPVTNTDRLGCPACGVGFLWSSDDRIACTHPDPDAGGAPGCGAEWDCVGVAVKPGEPARWHPIE